MVVIAAAAAAAVELAAAAAAVAVLSPCLIHRMSHLNTLEQFEGRGS